MSFQTDFESFLENVGAAIKDATELEVVTVSGTSQLKFQTSADNNNKGKIDFDSFFQDSGVLSGELHVVAATRLEIDGDTFLYVEDGADVELLKTHQMAVETAQEYRAGIVEGVLTIFRAT